MFPYNDSKLIKIKDLFIRQFLADIMFEIGAIRQKEDKSFEIDWDSISFSNYNTLINISLDCRAKLKDLNITNKEYCQAGRLFAYYILGKENICSDEHITVLHLKNLYSLFLAFNPLEISYNIFGGVIIR